MIDISVEEELIAYLKERKLINNEIGCNIEYCKGGVSGTVALINDKDNLMLIKQALNRLKVQEEWISNPIRAKIEYDCNNILYSIIPEYILRPYFFDELNNIFCREAAPVNFRMWKNDLINGKLDFQIATKYIDSISRIHNICADDNNVKQTFKNIDIFNELRLCPYIEFTVKKHPKYKEFANKVLIELREEKITLVHGDYSPKNVMIYGNKMYIMDFEVAHYGNPAFDLAFLSNHFILKAIKMKRFAESFLNMYEYCIQRYFDNVNYMDKNKLENCFIRTLCLMLIARVDGKSPVEYITNENDKEIIRKIGFEIINQELFTYKEMKNKVKDILSI